MDMAVTQMSLSKVARTLFVMRFGGRERKMISP